MTAAMNDHPVITLAALAVALHAIVSLPTETCERRTGCLEWLERTAVPVCLRPFDYYEPTLTLLGNVISAVGEYALPIAALVSAAAATADFAYRSIRNAAPAI
ncbi:MAG: hypothetical protein KGR16_08235 [Verrucomicrobia bacterium]|nr:hypothetical protein [Verrucomicrobiota bacterium]